MINYYQFAGTTTTPLAGEIACSWDLIYNSGTTATVTTTGDLYCKIWDENADWYRIDNSTTAFTTPCNTAISEWAWVGENDTHACTATYKWGTIHNGYVYPKILSPEEKEAMRREKLRKIIHNRCSPNIIVRNSKRQPLAMPMDIREQRARETLRRVIGDTKYGNFIKHGFISIKARSGMIYQIFPGHGITNVYNQGQMIDRLCVVLQGDFPPTDSLIMRYLLILNNEEQFRSYAIKHSVPQKTDCSRPGEADMKSLTEIFREMKVA